MIRHQVDSQASPVADSKGNPVEDNKVNPVLDPLVRAARNRGDNQAVKVARVGASNPHQMDRGGKDPVSLAIRDKDRVASPDRVDRVRAMDLPVAKAKDRGRDRDRDRDRAALALAGHKLRRMTSSRIPRGRARMGKASSKPETALAADHSSRGNHLVRAQANRHRTRGKVRGKVRGRARAKAKARARDRGKALAVAQVDLVGMDRTDRRMMPVVVAATRQHRMGKGRVRVRAKDRGKAKVRAVVRGLVRAVDRDLVRAGAETLNVVVARIMPMDRPLAQVRVMAGPKTGW
ncbi:MAG: hypothetical protein Alpg2KO_25610 [Alphaproteobacteria bacterium]